MDKHEQFKRLYKKFVEGKRWLKAYGRDADWVDFSRLVVEPMDALWFTFTDEEKAYWEMVKTAVEIFDGTILIEDEERRKRLVEERRKKWKRYFRSS